MRLQHDLQLVFVLAKMIVADHNVPSLKDAFVVMDRIVMVLILFTNFCGTDHPIGDVASTIMLLVQGDLAFNFIDFRHKFNSKCGLVAINRS